MLKGPIPGQSLTKEPRNYPWERPPETSDIDEAVTHHLARISQPEITEKILDGIANDMPIALITDLILTGAVAQGIHSIDMSLAVAPVVHDYIVGIAEDAGLDYKEFFEKDDDEELQNDVALSKARNNLSKGVEPEEEETEPMPEEKPKRGLMARRETI